MTRPGFAALAELLAELDAASAALDEIVARVGEALQTGEVPPALLTERRAAVKRYNHASKTVAALTRQLERERGRT